MRQQANIPTEIELHEVIEEAKAMRSKELARIGGNLLHLPQKLLRLLAQRRAPAAKNGTEPTHAA